VPRVLFDATGAVVDTIGWDPSPNPRMVPPAGFSSNRFQSITVGSRRLRVPDPPPELPIWVVLNDGRIIVETPLATDAATGRVLISRLDLEGDTVYHREYCYRPASWTAEGLDSLAARASRGPGAMFAVPSGGPSGSQEPDPAAQRALRAAMTFPEYRLPVQYVERDADGRLWVSRNEPEGSPVRRWALLDEDGLPIGELELPDRARILWSSGDFAWLLVPDEFDVPWLIRYRITMPVG
jgi:hypothetical protein